ncbi:MAG TPA: 50S ribosomal protein L3 N(5)-glutamine methyltransferase, partial [Polyangiaceae bacterium]
RGSSVARRGPRGIDWRVASRARRLSSDPTRERVLRAVVASSRRGTTTLRDLIRLGTSLFSKAGLDCQNSIGSAAADARYLAYFGLGLPYYEESFVDAKITEPEVLEVLSLFEQRISRRVTAPYITHEALYFGNSFYVDENVLTPRSLMADAFDALLRETTWQNERALDLCTGSGCIGITLALKRPGLRVDLVDVSPKALQVARINVKRYRLEDRVRVIQSDLFTRVEGPYSLIVSNPPYVANAEYDALAPEFKNEPRLALTAGDDGMDLVIPILRDAPRFLTPQGTLMVEVGFPAERLLSSRYPNVPFSWWRRAPDAPSGAFVLKNGYPVPAAD